MSRVARRLGAFERMLHMQLTVRRMTCRGEKWLGSLEQELGRASRSAEWDPLTTESDRFDREALRRRVLASLESQGFAVEADGSLLQMSSTGAIGTSIARHAQLESKMPRAAWSGMSLVCSTSLPVGRRSGPSASA